MAEWLERQLRDIADLRGGYGFPEDEQGIKSGSLPFYKVSDMNSLGNERYLRDANNYVDHQTARDNGWCILPPGAVVFAKVGAALLLNRRRILTVPSIIDNNMMAAVVSRELSTTWLYHWLLTIDFSRLVQVGALPSINQYLLGQIAVDIPPLEEQRRIAEILDTIDETIQATERVIVKRTAELEGLIEELTGRWARCATAHFPLGDLLDIRMDYRGRTPKKLGMDWGGGEIPALSANNVQMGTIDFSRECYLGSDNLYRRWMANGHTERGDLLITMEAPLGNIARVPDGRRYILSQRVVLLRFVQTLRGFAKVWDRGRFRRSLDRGRGPAVIGE